MTIRVQSPIRIDISGGTVDIDPISSFFYPRILSTVNISIGLYNEVKVDRIPGSRIEVITGTEVLRYTDRVDLEKKMENHLLTKAVYQSKLEGIHLEATVPVPNGSGLGASSSLIIAVRKALRPELSEDLLYKIAKSIESSVIKIPTGSQDYLAALNGGCNQIIYGPQGPRVNRIASSEFSGRLVDSMQLYYLGEPKRFSDPSKNPNYAVFRQLIENYKVTAPLLMKIDDCTNKVVQAIKAKRIDRIAELISQEMSYRIQLHPSILPDKTILEDLQELGADAKICGAGGGGTLLIMGGDTEAIRSLMKQRNAVKLDFEYADQGARVI